MKREAQDSAGCCACALLNTLELLATCRVARMEREGRDSAGRCAQLEKEFPWIAGEKQLFGYAALLICTTDSM